MPLKKNKSSKNFKKNKSSRTNKKREAVFANKKNDHALVNTESQTPLTNLNSSLSDAKLPPLQNKKKTLPKKTKKLIIILALIIIFTLTSIGVTIGVVLSKTAIQLTNSPNLVITNVYIPTNKSLGINLSKNCLPEGKNFADFKVFQQSDEFFTYSDTQIKSTQKSSASTSGSLIFYNDKIVYAKVNIYFVEVNSLITSKEQLLNIPDNSQLTYLINSEIDLQNTCPNIVNFRGIIYGNQHSVTNLKAVNQHSGFFKSTDNAKIVGIYLKDAKADMQITDTKKSGLLLADGLATEVSECKIYGNFKATINTDEDVTIGGAIGYMEDVRRHSDTESSAREIKNNLFMVNLDIYVIKATTPKIGGAIGGIINTLVHDNNSGGLIKISSAPLDTQILTEITLGGFCAYLEKVHPAVSMITKFDYTYNINVKTDFDITFTGNRGISKMGGIFGILANNNLENMEYNGKIKIKSTNKSDFYLGGVAGSYTKNMPLQLLTSNLKATVVDDITTEYNYIFENIFGETVFK